MKEYGITILLFAQIHLIVCIAISVKYGIDQVYGVALGAILILSLLIMCVLFWKRPKNFG